MEYSINVNGSLLQLGSPVVMGILNVTPDSFYAASRLDGERAIVERARAMLSAGASILDIGACSTRPGGELVSKQVELERLQSALALIGKEFPNAVLSVDTFRADVARRCVGDYNVAIINDVSGYDWDKDMFAAVAELRVPYILTHSVKLSQDEPAVPAMLKQLSQKMWELRSAGVADVIVDPGFGFGKTMEQNYEIMSELQEFSLLDAPLLVGISRKSMITKLLGITAAEALPGTMALNMVALSKGASILRVHDVPEAVQAISIAKALGTSFLE
ncbi:MAG: dihydropteroate synthase [Bacteroidaceae bacterium]|nr:dihydropteroate synthase [Bacteroidaceae bacterium]